MDKVYTEYEKRGFFHIGALPVAVLEGVTYEVKDAEKAAKNLARLPSWLGGDAGKHVELRGVKLVASPTHRLEGGRLLFLDNNRWELAGGVRLISGTNEFRAASATLRGGRGAGRRGHLAHHAFHHQHFPFRQHFSNLQSNRNQYRIKMKTCKAILVSLLLGACPAAWAQYSAGTNDLSIHQHQPGGH